jgi:hypothetical protein
MKLNRNIGMILLAIWLILTGLLPLLNLSISGIGTIMALLAIAAGVFILLPGRLGRGSGSSRLVANLGMLLLAIWLIVTGLLSVLSVNFPSSGIVLAILAVAAGVLILLRR